MSKVHSRYATIGQLCLTSNPIFADDDEISPYAVFDMSKGVKKNTAMQGYKPSTLNIPRGVNKRRSTGADEDVHEANVNSGLLTGSGHEQSIGTLGRY